MSHYHALLQAFLFLGAFAYLLRLKPSGLLGYWQDPSCFSGGEERRAAYLAIGALLVASALNFFQNQIGYDADEMLEFSVLGLPAYDRGWIWWGAYDEPLTHNVNALFCHLLGIRFAAFKATAFFFRTGAGIFAWLLARELFGSRVALWYALILASSVMFLCSMDTVIKEMSAPLVFLGCLFFTFRGLRTGGRVPLALGGAFAGLAPYTYISWIAMGAALLCWPLLIWLSDEKTYPLIGRKVRFFWWMAGGLLLAAPFLFHLVKYPHAQVLASPSTNQISWQVGGLPLVLQVAWANFAGIFYRGDAFFTRNFKALPMLWWPWVFFFWVGLAAMLRRIRETRISVPLLLMAACMGLAGLNCFFVPNFKLSRVALFLSVFPAAIGTDLLASRLSRRWGVKFLWSPLVFAVASFLYAGVQWNDILREPLSWWFRDVVRPREAFVHANPQYRYFGIGSWISDMREGSAVTEVGSLRQVLETPGDGRDAVFLFPDGREPWQRNLIRFWTALYPGGNLKIHTRPVREGDWPMFISYQLPSASYWSLPRAPEDAATPNLRAAIWWQRAEILSQHGLPLEAWRDALRAARIDPRYYARADALLDNKRGREGRLSVLLRSQLWSEAHEELALASRDGKLSTLEVGWKVFLDSHGLEMRFYSGYTAQEPAIATMRGYMPQLHMGYYQAFIRHRLHFSAVARGQIFIPRTGRYRFQTLAAPGNPVTLRIDGTNVLELSRDHGDGLLSEPVLLKGGLHAFYAENCTPLRFEGKPLVPSCIPDPLSYAYACDPCWSLTWQYEDEPAGLVPPECLYAPGGQLTPIPPLP